MNLLLTNDDGIEAAGLRALLGAARGLGEPVVVAPAGPQSGVSHAVTTGTAVRFEDRGPDRYAVYGTPADCARIRLNRLCPDAAWVLSGINHGGNLGADVYYSGTVAAVREAVLHGWNGIAFSHYRRREMEFEVAENMPKHDTKRVRKVSNNAAFVRHLRRIIKAVFRSCQELKMVRVSLTR